MNVEMENGHMKITYNEEETALLDRSIAEIIQKYNAQSRQPMSEEMIEALDYRLCGILYREGEDAVINYVKAFEYKAPTVRPVGYA